LPLCLAKYHVPKTYRALKHHTIKTYGGGGGIAQRILNIDASNRRVVSFTTRLLYSREKRPRHPFDRRVGGSQRRGGVEKNIPAGNRFPVAQPVDQSL